MHVLFLSPNFPTSQRPFVRALHQAGARVTGIGESAPESLDPELCRWLHGYEQVPSLGDEPALLEVVRRVQAQEWVHRFECTLAPYQAAVARVRDACDISGLSAEQTSLCHDKFLLKRRLRELGIACARSVTVETSAEARAFVAEVGLPVLVEPRDGRDALRVETGGQLEDTLRRLGLGVASGGRKRTLTLEEFYPGHEGFYNTLSVGGQVVFEAVSHCYPNPLDARRTREINPYIVTTNRVESDGYSELRAFGRAVHRALGIDLGAAHLQWSFGGRGLWLNGVEPRPPGARFWELYNLANEMDLHLEWARALCTGRAAPRPTRRFSAGLLAIRPNRDGRVKGEVGVEECRRRYGAWIEHVHLPAIGQHTAELGTDYTAHGWMWVKHPDYDELRRILEHIGQLVHIVAE